jgi:uncharacterized membrane protein
MEKRVRSLLKAISWRIVASLTTFFLVFIFTRDFVISSSVSFAELFSKTAIYYLHERLWNLIGFGREKE